MLEKNPYDQAAWLLKCKALTKKNWVDDLEVDEEGIADILMGKFCLKKALLSTYLTLFIFCE